MAKKLGRKYLGIDVSDEYCITANKRLLTLKTQMGLFSDEY